MAMSINQARLCPVIPLTLAAALFVGSNSQAAAQGLEFNLSTDRGPSVRLAALMARHVNFDGFDDPKLTLGAALLKWAETYDITLWLNSDTFRRESNLADDELRAQLVARKPIPPMRDVPVEEVLRTILNRVPATRNAAFIYRSDHIEIATPRRAVEVARKKMRSLIAEYLYRMNESNWNNLDGYGVDALRTLGELAYWNKVMIDNTKAMATAKASPRK
jgi:hypothetical protein